MATITTVNNGDSGLVARNSINNNFTNLNADKAEIHVGMTAAPTVNSDAPTYAVGDIWLDETNDKVYVCVDSTDGAAVWQLGMTAAERVRFEAMEDSATADQSGAEIKVAYEAEADTNAFTDDDHTKLD